MLPIQSRARTVEQSSCRILASTLATRAREDGAGDRHYLDARDIVMALADELQRYVDEPAVTTEALAVMQAQERGRMH